MLSIGTLVVPLFLLLGSAFADASSRYEVRPRAIQPNPQNGHWVDTWTAMPQLTEYTNLPLPPFNQTTSVFKNSTLRQTLRATLPAAQIRLQISNAFGVTSLPITAATIALPSNGSAGTNDIDTSTLQTLTFSGNGSISIPDGGLAVSDVLNFPVKTGQIITISLYLQDGQNTTSITSHPGSRITSYWQFGNAVDAEQLTISNATTQTAAHWFFISALEAWVSKDDVSFVIAGDSITDGRGSTDNLNNRWPDLLFDRLQTLGANSSTHTSTPNLSHIAISNQAAGGNRILADGNGPSLLSRIERDILAHPHVSYAMIFEGVNDIGTAASIPSAQAAVTASLIQAYSQITTRIHASGIPVFGATITPFSAPGFNTTAQAYGTPEREATRQEINAWIRGSGVFDAVLDFDALLRNETDPSVLKEALQSGDWLHPNPAGYEVLAQGFDVGVFAEWAGGWTGL